MGHIFVCLFIRLFIFTLIKYLKDPKSQKSFFVSKVSISVSEDGLVLGVGIGVPGQLKIKALIRSNRLEYDSTID